VHRDRVGDGAALGDELAVSAAFATADARDLRDVLRGTVAAVGARPDRVLSFLARAPAVIREHEVASCEVAQAVAGRLGMPASVTDALGQVFERWDGRGHPGRCGGAGLHPAVRVWQVAHVADLLSREDDVPGVAAGLQRRAGRSLDPDVARAAASAVGTLLAAETEGLAALLAAEPLPHRTVADDRIDDVLAVFGLLADLKSPAFLGHSGRVAGLASAAARLAGLPETEVVALRRAGLVHDVGRVAVSSRVWDKRGSLGDTEWEQVRLHPYYTSRALARVPALSGVAELACAHHERCDGSGYHRGLGGPAFGTAAALLAAADTYVAAGEPRAHRAAHDDAARSALLRADVAAGRLPAVAVDAVLAASGQLPVPPPVRDCALTPRELEVLELVAGGLTNAAAGRRLGISAKTVNAHLEHVYAKLAVSTRASAVVQAMQRGWLTP